MIVLKILYNDSNDKDICIFNGKRVDIDQIIIVDTPKGKRVARVYDIVYSSSTIVSTENKFVKVVNNDDRRVIEKNSKMAKSALLVARKYADILNLNIGFVSSEYTFDRKQLFFLFVADTRIDFRELARKLAQKYKTRIELRQIGVRDKARLIGGLGPCGLPLCCNNFLIELNSVSINMAKNQMLALNPNKINGVCGRLLCCLQFEDDYYKSIRKKNPSIGEIILYEGSECRVIDCNYVNLSYKLQKKDGEIVSVRLEDLK